MAEPAADSSHSPPTGNNKSLIKKTFMNLAWGLDPRKIKSSINVISLVKYIYQNFKTCFLKAVHHEILTVILRATLSNWEASSLILWTIRRRGPPSGGGRERWASMVLPATKCNWTAAWSFFSAKRPCHTIGYFWGDGILKTCFSLLVNAF